MFSTINKTETLRTARAQAVLRAATPIDELVKSGPKGNALEIARAAGILAAKRTWEIIPYCHPIPIDHIAVDFETDAAEVKITATVQTVWKTGVEMEALMAAQIAATTLFDMLKPVVSGMVITEARVLEKTGGKTNFKEVIPKGFKAAVIVTSDGTHAKKRPDKSGQIILEALKNYGIADPAYHILPDEAEAILKKLRQCHQEKFDLVLTTGGTGLGPRDVTVEATRKFIDREVPGVMEAARAFGQQRTPYAMLSRGLAGLKGGMLVVNLPGSSKGTQESLNAIFPAILHGYKMMAGGGH
ncbi:MAG: bifunctional molybdenum cofactor biosynthesis protein MoaC/MoaB [Deltaproteobacteria bacterium]|nr:bifunctional molybdenum cofactor biosynthesis protein MoaC/MoaB [Deltaproteobacteria bacterium]